MFPPDFSSTPVDSRDTILANSGLPLMKLIGTISANIFWRACGISYRAKRL